MAQTLRLALAQTNFCVGDIGANCARIISIAGETARHNSADIVVFPELAITGYPPEDLLFRPGLYRRVGAALDDIIAAVPELALIVGYPEKTADGVYNSCAVIQGGAIVANYRKRELPNYAVFDEKRYFVPGHDNCVFDYKGVRIGLSICEDIWNADNAASTAQAGADLVVNLNASPYHIRKFEQRLAAVGDSVTKSGLPVVYVNTVGGQDELVFDGASFAMNADGEIAGQSSAFVESLTVIEAHETGQGLRLRGDIRSLEQDEAAVYAALVLGVRDYVRKNQFEGCVLGLSGGIDSALTLSLAVDALGPEAVTAISMPSQYTASMSIEDAEAEAAALGCAFHVVAIKDVVDSFEEALAPVLPPDTPRVTAENLQARSRGVILMGFSNATGSIVLATGNKSEMAVGYATLYGDMAGGFAPLKDIPKTLVYRLAKWRNRETEVIPTRVIERPPTAELAPDQKDSDSLPPYDVLDPILERYIEMDMTPREIAEDGFDLETARRVAKMVDRNEYKRQQAAPGARITTRAFGRDRRFPITSRYNEQTPVKN